MKEVYGSVNSGNGSDPASLPKLGEIYDLLRRGRHLTRKDSDVFHHLDEREDDYRKLFDQLGYDLVRHDKDFFYFQKDDYISNYGKRFAAFVFVVIDYYADQGYFPEDVLTDETFRIDEKPFVNHDKRRYREVLEKVGIDFDEPSPYDRLLSDLERFGFAERDGRFHFSFRKPIYRFLDLAKDLSEAAGEEEQ